MTASERSSGGRALLFRVFLAPPPVGASRTRGDFLLSHRRARFAVAPRASAPSFASAARLRGQVTMAEVTDIKLFGKWSYDDIEVCIARPSPARLSLDSRRDFVFRVPPAHLDEPRLTTPSPPSADQRYLTRGSCTVHQSSGVIRVPSVPSHASNSPRARDPRPLTGGSWRRRDARVENAVFFTHSEVFRPLVSSETRPRGRRTLARRIRVVFRSSGRTSCSISCEGRRGRRVHASPGRRGDF